jgi:high affinity Mn2+ porin
MKPVIPCPSLGVACLACCFPALQPLAAESPENTNPSVVQSWNWHVQNTAVVQGDPGFAAKYSGPQSLNSKGEVQETVTLDVFAGARLWRGAEAHVDGLMAQGFGLSHTLGVEAFPNGDANKAGNNVPYGMFARLFIRQTIGLGGEQEDVPDGPLTVAGRRDISRLTFTLGRFTPLDIVDNNAYANDPHRQFMNWALMNNAAFDYAGDTTEFTTGFASELNQQNWALRYGFFQMPRDKNGWTAEDRFLKWPPEGSDGPFLHSWGMVAELERRYRIRTHPGAIRFLAWLNEAHMASYQAALPILLANGPGADISAARAYRHKYGFGLNWEQEVVSGVGVFARLGWNDGHQETWEFTDMNHYGSLGVSINGQGWRRPGDTFGLGGILGGASRDNQKFLEAGGNDLLDGDGALTYGLEKAVETYYDFKIWKTIHTAVDYQFVINPAFNRDRGPVSILGARLHWEF